MNKQYNDRRTDKTPENYLSRIKPLQVEVRGDFEEAFRRFKSVFQKERIVSMYKERRFYEKPSARRRRKKRESIERKLATEKREALIRSGEWDRIQKKKQLKRKGPPRQRPVETEPNV